MRNPLPLLVSLFVICLLPDLAFAQSKYDATGVSTIEAIARGEVREALSALEAKAAEAEKNAASSPSPQQYLIEGSKGRRDFLSESEGRLSRAVRL